VFDAGSFELAGAARVLLAACNTEVRSGAVVIWVEGVAHRERGADEGFHCGVLRLVYF